MHHATKLRWEVTGIMNLVSASLVAILLLSSLAGCGGTTEPEALANIVAFGPGTWVTCLTRGCDLNAEARNTGIGCATDIRGITRFYDIAGEQNGSGFSWQTSALPNLVRPNEAFTYVVRSVPLSIRNNYETFVSEISWTNVRC